MNSSSDETQRPAIVWLRDDLRVSDNPALKFAADSGKPVIVLYVYCYGEGLTRPFGAAQKWFLHHALMDVSKSLAKIGGKLTLVTGDPRQIIPKLVDETQADLISWNRRVGEKELKIDTELKKSLQGKEIDVHSHQGSLLHEPFLVKTASGGPYRVYTPFWKSFSSGDTPRKPLTAPPSLKSYEGDLRHVHLQSLKLLPNKPNWAEGWQDIWNVSENGAQEVLSHFLENGIHGYNGGRDFPAKRNVSRLSPYLRFGLISPYQIWQATKFSEETSIASNGDCEKFLKELVWREFAYHLLFHYPDLGHINFSEKFDRFPWAKPNPKTLVRWQMGNTGYPIVDAGMRELWQTGYMHNRVRMVVGSFLVKHLLIDWREGEKWFWDTLVDGDPANNTSSWQWIAGCGADAAPYFRIFNPILQGKKFDPDGEYVRQYVPEIAKLPDKYLHNPWEAPAEILTSSDVKLGETYPEPMVDHNFARKRALAAFKELSPEKV